ncbi:hypothetical protein D9M68_747520 [compost metagenome]
MKVSTASTTRLRVSALWSARYRLIGATLQSGATSSEEAPERALFITNWSRDNSAHFGLPSLRARMLKRISPYSDRTDSTPSTSSRCCSNWLAKSAAAKREHCSTGVLNSTT